MWWKAFSQMQSDVVAFPKMFHGLLLKINLRNS